MKKEFKQAQKAKNISILKSAWEKAHFNSVCEVITMESHTEKGYLDERPIFYAFFKTPKYTVWISAQNYARKGIRVQLFEGEFNLNKKPVFQNKLFGLIDFNFNEAIALMRTKSEFKPLFKMFPEL